MPPTPPTAMPASRPPVRVGVGGWTYAPWRSNFYPLGLPHSQELAYASRQLTTIEVNGTYYATMKPAHFKKWHDDTPDDFVFSLEASRHATNRRVLAEAGESIAHFVDSGIRELGPKLGPVVWQFMPTKAFDAADFEAFLALLPAEIDGLALRHVVDVRHESFMAPEFLALARRYKVATVFADSETFPSFADLTGDFVYARLLMSSADEPSGYEAQALTAWASRARRWNEGHAPQDLPSLNSPQANGAPREVFVYFINGAKEKAPAATLALLAELAKP